VALCCTAAEADCRDPRAALHRARTLLPIVFSRPLGRRSWIRRRLVRSLRQIGTAATRARPLQPAQQP